MVQYDIIANAFTYEINSFDDEKKIKEELVEMLITKKVKLNINIYNYLSKYDEYLQILNYIDVDSNILEDTMKSNNIDIIKKKKIFSKIDFSYFKEKTNEKNVEKIIKNFVFLNSYIVNNIFNALTKGYKIIRSQ